MLCTFYYDVVTAVCQLLINEYVMLCYVTLTLTFNLISNVLIFASVHCQRNVNKKVCYR